MEWAFFLPFWHVMAASNSAGSVDYFEQVAGFKFCDVYLWDKDELVMEVVGIKDLDLGMI